MNEICPLCEKPITWSLECTCLSYPELNEPKQSSNSGTGQGESNIGFASFDSNINGYTKVYKAVHTQCLWDLIVWAGKKRREEREAHSAMPLVQSL